MKGSLQTQMLDGSAVSLYLPPQRISISATPLPCLYIAGQEQPTQSELLLGQIMQLLEPQIRRGILPSFAAVSVSPLQWDAAYSPWPAMLGERSFSGKSRHLLFLFTYPGAALSESTLRMLRCTGTHRFHRLFSGRRGSSLCLFCPPFFRALCQRLRLSVVSCMDSLSAKNISTGTSRQNLSFAR